MVTFRSVRAIAWKGDWVITSPNAPFIPPIPEGDLSLEVREDGWFGPDDYVVTPQQHSAPVTLFLSCVPRPATGIPNVPSLHPTQDDWEPLTTRASHLGMYRRTFLLSLQTQAKDIVAKLRSQPPVSFPAEGGYSSTLKIILNRLEAGLSSLQNHYTTFPAALLRLREVQRFFLMAKALYSWVTLYSHRGNTGPDSAGSFDDLVVDASLMGLITSNEKYVQKAFKAGVPVWWIRSSSSLKDYVIPDDARHLPRQLAVSRAPYTALDIPPLYVGPQESLLSNGWPLGFAAVFNAGVVYTTWPILPNPIPAHEQHVSLSQKRYPHAETLPREAFLNTVYTPCKSVFTVALPH